MDLCQLNNQLKYVEQNGNTLNTDEKMRITLAIKQLKIDLNVSCVKLVGKITGK